MLDFKRLGKTLICLVLCLVCLVVANPVSATSAQSDASSAPAAQAEKKPAELMVSYVRYSGYNGSTIIGCMANGTVLTVLGSKGNFYKIDCYDMVGYIAKSQVTVNEAGQYIVQAASGSRETAYLPTFSAQKVLELRSELAKVSKRYIGVPYVWGGTTPSGFDCSGYTQYVYRKLGITLNRTAAWQASNGIVVAREDLQPGDLVIFSNTSGYRFGTHIGLYLGNGKIIHSGSSKGVTIADLDSNYFDSHFECARRVILTESTASAIVPSVGSITGGIGADWRN